MTSVITLSDPSTGAQARIAPALGFNCFEFVACIDGQAIPVIDSPADVLAGNSRPSGFGIPILFPFPNRIRAGHFHWAGQEYRVPLAAGKPNAIHGFCYDRPWRVSSQTENGATGLFQLSVDDPARRECWPTDFQIEVRYQLQDNRLDCQFRVTNPDSRPLPWGLGTHAYFKVPFSEKSTPADCVFRVPVAEEWELDESLPTGKIHAAPAALSRGIRFGEAKFDNVFTKWQPESDCLQCQLIDEVAGIELVQACDQTFFREAVVFTPPERNAVCIEPYTCVTDAINLHEEKLDTGLNILPPGSVVETWAAIAVRRVIA